MYGAIKIEPWCDKLESLIRLTPLPTIEWNLERQVVVWNPAAERVFGYSRREALGRRLEEDPIVPADGRELALDIWHQVVGEGLSVQVVRENTTRSGARIQCAWHLAPLCDEAGRITGVLSQAQEVTAVKERRREQRFWSFFDALTGLPNRTRFNEHLRRIVDRTCHEGGITGLLMLGLDRFKAVNDALGIEVGDQVLREAAARLANCVRDSDTVARFGGDEFAIIVPDIRDAADLGAVAHKILACFSQPFRFGDGQLALSVSVGIALFPGDSADVEELSRFADSALLHAKESGRNNFQFYSAELTSNAVERMELEAGLRQVLKESQLELYFQPQVDLSDGAVVGAEALLRWHHPSRGMVLPDQFIGIAEDAGLISAIGEWVLRRSCRAAFRWNRDGRSMRVAVNLSSRQFGSGQLPDLVAAVLMDTGCRPEWLELEITEGLLLEDGPVVSGELAALGGMGIALAIDDFGTGYSALSYIKRFAVATLKIDRVFIHDVAVNPHSAELARAIASLALSLRLRVVAEGIESEGQEVFLKGCGCHVGQGYLYGRPMPLGEFESLI